jgi:hypothetical protein
MEISKREIVVDSFSKENFGIKSKDGVWYNLNKSVSEQFKKDVQAEFTKLGKGDILEMAADFPSRIYNIIKITKKAEKKQGGWQEDITNFEDLLAALHKKFKSITLKTEKIEVDLENKYALFKATVTADGLSFEAHGDATKDNIDSNFVQPHFIRMAETRAICRALRFITNNAACSEEETYKGNDSISQGVK